jgi:hypothetical protein
VGNIDTLFGDVHWAQMRQANFEAERVMIVLKTFKLTDTIPAMLDCQDHASGERRLTFAAFHACFSTFPVLLEAHAAGGVAERCSPAALLRSFGHLFLLDRYLEAYARQEETAQGRPVGLVIPFGGYRGGVLLHNSTIDTRATRIVHDLAGDVPPYRVTVEPFISFVKYLARSGWTPRKPLAVALHVQGPKVRRAVPLRPWMVTAVGTGPALPVLAWLCGVLCARSAYHRLFVVRLGPDVRGVAATHEEIATATGLNTYQVKRGLATLRDMGFLSTRTYQAKSLIVLDQAKVRQARAETRS